MGTTRTTIETTPQDNGQLDAFGRKRTSVPTTISNNKQIFDNMPLFWDDQEVSGSGTTSVHSANHARTRIGVSATTAGKRVRQTFMRFNYSTGSSQRILMTCANLDCSTGVIKGFGYGTEDNGLFLVNEEGTLKFYRRSNTTGTPVDTKTNISILDRDGDPVDLTKTMILDIDFQWLGVGRVRAAYVQGIDIIYFYEKEGLDINEVYMSTPNLPARYWIENDGSGALDTFDTLCTSIQTESGAEDVGILRYSSTEDNLLNCNTSGTVYAIHGMRLKSTHLGASVKIVGVTVKNNTSDDFEWYIILNPTLANAVTWVNETNGAVQVANGNGGAHSNSTVTGGTKLVGGFVKSGNNSGDVTIGVKNARLIGSAIDNTPDEIFLCVMPLSANADISGGITRRVLS